MSENGFDSFTSIPAVKAAFSAAGNPWFSPSTMKWFKCKIETALIGGRYFISSEQAPEGERLYTIRKVVREADGRLSIDTIGEFQQYTTRSLARGALIEHMQATKD